MDLSLVLGLRAYLEILHGVQQANGLYLHWISRSVGMLQIIHTVLREEPTAIQN